ncbi:hypothetical protein Dsin_015124 [Dipteronia sinensis]|uniref:Uncharacterized protein n=1 Tax=Dipteronia sinensis TaxID=43782 RepID=A0AAE0EAP5_9ROSI|nr:hypothetical protein Dsin_015124 [Dipteronia sinensis]
MVLLTSWEVVSARGLSDRQSGTVKPSLHSKSASLKGSPPATAAPVYPSIPRPAKGPCTYATDMAFESQVGEDKASLDYVKPFLVYTV